MQGESNPIEALDMFQNIEALCDEIWNLVTDWDYFAKDTIGKQLVRAADSIGANLTEGDGRYHFKEKLNFDYIARGSLKETGYWLRRAQRRGLLTQEQTTDFLSNLEAIRRFINSLISRRRQSITQLREPTEEYTPDLLNP